MTSPLVPTLLRETAPSIWFSPSVSGAGPTGNVLGQTIRGLNTLSRRLDSQSKWKPRTKSSDLIGIDAPRSWNKPPCTVTVFRPGAIEMPAAGGGASLLPGADFSPKPPRIARPHADQSKRFCRTTTASTDSSSLMRICANSR